MRWFDLFRWALAALGQQKLRTSLTTLGVVFGAFVLAASLSINEGVQETIQREASKGDAARKVTVHPAWRANRDSKKDQVEVKGRMSAERHERIRKALADRRGGGGLAERVDLTSDRLETLARLPHVRRLIPIVGGPVVATLGHRPEDASLSSGAGEDPEFRKRVVAGRAFEAEDERSVLLSEMFAYRIGLVDDADIAQVIGKPLRIEFWNPEEGPSFEVSLAGRSRGGGRDEWLALRQLAWQLPGMLDQFRLTADESSILKKAIRQPSAAAVPIDAADDYQVVGIFRELTHEENKDAWSRFPADTDLILPRQTAVDLYFRDPARRKGGVHRAVLLIDDMRNVKEVVDRVEALDLRSESIVRFVERERLTYLLIFGGMTCVAAVALLVSALGIANTMLMSVLQRRREIGIMKAVGAADWQLQALFLVEGGLIGLIGGVSGLLLAWTISFPGDAWVRSMIRRDMQIDLSGSIFAFPARIGVIVLFFTIGVTVVAALYPARRASKVDPVTALRHD